MEKALRGTDKLLDTYKERYIVDSGGVIEVVKKDGSRFIIDLDDSKANGNRTSVGMSFDEQLREAYNYIDWATDQSTHHKISDYIDLSGADDVFIGKNKVPSYVVYLAKRDDTKTYKDYHYKITIWEPKIDNLEGCLVKNEFCKTKEDALSALRYEEKLLEDGDKQFVEVCEDEVKYTKGGLVVPSKEYLEKLGYVFEAAPEKKQRIGENWSMHKKSAEGVSNSYVTDVHIMNLAKQLGFSHKSLESLAYADGGAVSGARKFDNTLLQEWKDNGGSSLTVLKELTNLKNVRQAFYGSRLVDYNVLIASLSDNDKKIIADLKREWNWHEAFAQGGHLNSVGSDLSDQMWGADPTYAQAAYVTKDTYEPTIYTSTQFDESMEKGGLIDEKRKLFINDVYTQAGLPPDKIIRAKKGDGWFVYYKFADYLYKPVPHDLILDYLDYNHELKGYIQKARQRAGLPSLDNLDDIIKSEHYKWFGSSDVKYGGEEKMARGGNVYRLEGEGVNDYHTYGDGSKMPKYITAKNLDELEKEVTKRYGSKDKIFVSRRSKTTGAEYPVQFNDGGSVGSGLDVDDSRTKLVVLNNHTLGYILPDSKYVSPLRASILKGATSENPIMLSPDDDVRLASEKDFEEFGVSFNGYKNDPDNFEFASNKDEETAHGVDIADGHVYQLGDKYRDDFDVNGLFDMAAMVDAEWSIDDLQKLYVSLTDINYHETAALLEKYIKLRKENKPQSAELALEKFKEDVESDDSSEEFANGGVISDRIKQFMHFSASKLGLSRNAPNVTRKYELGDLWSDDFDYDGMVAKAKEVDAKWSLSNLKKLFNSLENVSYHTAAKSLDKYISAKKAKKTQSAKMALAKFKSVVDEETKMSKGGAISDEIKELLSKVHGSNVLPSSVTDALHIVKDRFRSHDNPNAEADAKAKKKALEADGYAVKTQKLDYSDLGRGIAYVITAIKKKEGVEAFEKGGSFTKCPVGTEVQTFIFSKEKFSNARVKAWIKEYGKVEGGAVETNTMSRRVRQKDPSEFVKDSFRTIDIANGIKAVIGCPIKKKKKGGLIEDLNEEMEQLEEAITGIGELIADAKSGGLSDVELQKESQALRNYWDTLHDRKHFIEKKSMVSPDKYDLRYKFNEDLVTMFRNFFVNMGGKVEKDKMMNFIDGLNPSVKSKYLKAWKEYKKIADVREKDGIYIVRLLVR
jgi:hypothetical protein